MFKPPAHRIDKRPTQRSRPAFGEKLAEQCHRINPDRQGNCDIIVDAQLTLAGLVARYISLLPSEPFREVDLTKPGAPPRHGQRSNDAGVQVRWGMGDGHPEVSRPA